MNSNEVSKQLLDSLNTRKDKTCIIVDGEWGIGKTFCINPLISDFEKYRYDKFIYFSLFGKKIDINVVEKSLLTQLLLSPIASINKSSKGKMLSNFSTALAENLGIKINFDSILNNINIENIETTEKVLICIDDIERKDSLISMKDILGLAERISAKFSVILILNSKKLDDDDSLSYNLFREKIVDDEYIISSIDENLIKNKILDVFNSDNISDSDITKIISIIKKAECSNIRIIEKYLRLMQNVNKRICDIRQKTGFQLNGNYIETSYDVVAYKYLNADEKDNGVFKLIKNVSEHTFNETDPELNFTISSLGRDLTEAEKDAFDILEGYTLPQNELDTLICKVYNKICNIDTSYFSSQECLLLINEVLKRMRFPKDIHENLLELAKKLYVYKISYLYDQEIRPFTLDEANNQDESTDKLCKEINESNYNTTVEYIKVNLMSHMEANNSSEYMILFNRSFDAFKEEETTFLFEQFKLLYEQILTNYSDFYIKCLNDLLSALDSDDMINFLEEKSSNSNTYKEISLLHALQNQIDFYN